MHSEHTNSITSIPNSLLLACGSEIHTSSLIEKDNDPRFVLEFKIATWIWGEHFSFILSRFHPPSPPPLSLVLYLLLRPACFDPADGSPCTSFFFATRLLQFVPSTVKSFNAIVVDRIKDFSLLLLYTYSGISCA